MSLEALKTYNTFLEENSLDYLTWLISLAESNPALDVRDLRKKHNFIRRCNTATWISAFSEGHKWYFHSDSDSKINKGIAKIIVDVCNGCTSEEINKLALEDFKYIISPLNGVRRRTFQLMLNHIQKQVNVS